MSFVRHHDPELFLVAAMPLVAGDIARLVGLRAWVDGMRRVAVVERSFLAVYTRPPFRARGYASALVATICAELVAAGRQVFLVTDAANPTSNALYARLGFVPLGDTYGFDLVDAR